MSRTFHNGERRIRVKGVRREKPDVRKLARALIEMARLEREAEAEHQQTAVPRPPARARAHGAPKPKRQRRAP